VDEWLPGRHLARFVVEVIDGLDLRSLSASYRGPASASYHPAVLLGLLVYGYATGVFSSRKLERSTYDSVAFRFIAANDHLDHDTIATFRRRFLKEVEGRFVKVLLLAREMGFSTWHGGSGRDQDCHFMHARLITLPNLLDRSAIVFGQCRAALRSSVR
jgi:transposase